MKMKVRPMLVLKIAIGLLIVFAVSLSLLYLKIFRPVIIEIKKARQREMRLLCETDHQALLKACREISRQVARGDLKKSQYWIRKNPDPETSRFPQVILELEATYINIDQDGRLMLELGGGLDHFGVYAYPEDYKYEEPISDHGDKELIPGLWFYADGYRESPEYQKKIDTLLQKTK